MQARFFNQDDVEMVELTNPADKNSVILPATDEHRSAYPQAYDQHAGRPVGNSSGHNASLQTTALPVEPVKADNSANDASRDDDQTGNVEKREVSVQERARIDAETGTRANDGDKVR